MEQQQAALELFGEAESNEKASILTESKHYLVCVIVDEFVHIVVIECIEHLIMAKVFREKVLSGNSNEMSSSKNGSQMNDGCLALTILIQIWFDAPHTCRGRWFIPNGRKHDTHVHG